MAAASQTTRVALRLLQVFMLVFMFSNGVQACHRKKCTLTVKSVRHDKLAQYSSLSAALCAKTWSDEDLDLTDLDNVLTQMCSKPSLWLAKGTKQGEKTCDSVDGVTCGSPTTNSDHTKSVPLTIWRATKSCKDFVETEYQIKWVTVPLTPTINANISCFASFKLECDEKKNKGVDCHT